MVSGFLWWFKVLDKCLPPWGSGLTPTVSPRFHRPHSTEHKTPRLTVKPQPRTPKETHKVILRKEQEKRDEKDKNGVKNEESNQAIKQIYM